MASLARLQILICVVVGFVLPTYAGIIFAPVLNTCGSGGGTVLQDVVSMAKAAGAYMDNAPGNQKGDAKGHWDFYRVATLFDVIFGAQDGNSQGRWNEVRSNIQTIANLENTQPNAYVLCDDSKFWTAFPSNGQPTQFKNPVDNTLYDYPSAVTCGDSTSTGGSLIAYRINIGGTEFISICGVQNSHPAQLSELQPKNVEGALLPDMLSWSVVFFHEIMHVLFADQRGDVVGGGPPGECYSWTDILSIRGDYGEKNPRSTTLFALALSFEEWFWHSGSAVKSL